MLHFTKSTSTWSYDAVQRKWCLLLKHTSDFYGARIRPFLRASLRIFRCANDVQWWTGNGMVLRYCSGYLNKYAESWDVSWLSEATNPMVCGIGVCRRWKPAAHEMAMVLGREQMCFTNFRSKQYRVPAFSEEEDRVLHLYRRRSRTLEQQSCHEWLRRHAVHSNGDRAWATQYTTNCFTYVGLQYYAFPKDDFFFQWLAMNHVHRLCSDLLPGVTNSVSRCFRFFACALALHPEKWGSDAWVQAFIELQGHKADYVNTRVHEIAARRNLIRKQQNGLLPRWQPIRIRTVASFGNLDAEQAAFIDMIANDVALRDTEGDATVAEQLARRMRFLTGGPGAGKTYCVLALLKHLTMQKIHVLVMTPTGKLAAEIGTSEFVHAMTVARACGLRPDRDDGENTSLMRTCAVWVVGEVEMLPQSHFERIVYNWFEYHRHAVLVLDGDFQQLPPPVSGDAYDARDSRMWRLVTKSELHGQYRCVDDDGALVRFQASVRCQQPSAADLFHFCQPLLISDMLSEESVHEAWNRYPNAIILAAKNKTVNWINSLALERFGTRWLCEIQVGR
jgi:hypothetical protein